jgi:hypothetical protein
VRSAAHRPLPFLRGALPGVRLGAIVLLAGLAALIAASAAFWLGLAALGVGLAVSRPLSPEFPGASRWAFVAVLASAILFVDSPTLLVLRTLVDAAWSAFAVGFVGVGALAWGG